MHKESDRALKLKEENAKMEVSKDIEDDLMVVHGGKGVKGAKVRSHHDHRIAMACAVAALRADGVTIIVNGESVNMSYPSFYTDLEKLGAGVSLGNKIIFNE